MSIAILTKLFGTRSVTDFILELITINTTDRKSRYLPYFRGRPNDIKKLFDTLEIAFPDVCKRYSSSVSAPIVLLENYKSSKIRMMQNSRIFLSGSKPVEADYHCDAVWRRLLVINLVPFDDGNLRPDNILNLLPVVREVLTYGTIVVPDSIKNATKEAREKNYYYYDFLNDCCVRDPQSSIEISNLYNAYKQWVRARKLRNYDNKRVFIWNLQIKFKCIDVLQGWKLI